MTVASTPLLSVRGCVNRFPGVMALQGLDFAVRADEAHCLLRQNGAGESVLTKVLSGALRPDEGEIRWPGETVESGTPAKLSTMDSRLPRPGPWRGWDFVSTGHGDVPWERTFRMLGTIGCAGPISVDREDAGTDRLVGRPRHWSSLAATLWTRGRRRSDRAAEGSADERRRSWPNESACG
ncbi:ATP-binding cassette domain-containing protein [Lentzea flaviverrucosa]|uniref:ABC transporter n=1 Tax=Lentzea flaviverrucosa TaxID=200379 RepID=A0A1H9BMV2_9PSEU|nr:ABC transporter family protein [Lentzea flaviverrucosa]SEP90097.1 ABC transporter [Lentzea flaviverrucosa]